jgi:predicted transcriptional regulator
LFFFARPPPPRPTTHPPPPPPPGSGTRSAQALALVQAKPGITIPEMGKEMGITPNYLYRVLPELAKDGKVKKQGKGWVPA